MLYPGDGSPAGQELRLRQEYFFSSASLQDLLGRHIRQHGDVRTLADKAAIQLNDTHPSIAIPELMRLLLDDHDLPWDAAWQITTATFSYTNHTLLPEALETWPVTLVERLLPRHMQIIHQINRSHLDGLVATRGAATPPLAAVSLIDDDGGRRVRMGTLAFLGSHKVNGVSALHTELMRQTVFRDMHALYPDRIVNRTNGITFRRWLFAANPGLTGLLVEVVGPRCWMMPARWKASRRRPTMPACTTGWRQSAAPTRSRWPGWWRSASTSGSTPTRCSTCRSSDSTSTSGSC